MWILFWKTYKLAKGATFISIVGALMRYAAVLCIFYGAAVGFLICGAIGVGLHFLAECINNGKWKKLVEKEGYAARIAAGDVETAVAVYNTNPTKAALKYIASKNEQMAEEVRTRINQK